MILVWQLARLVATGIILVWQLARLVATGIILVWHLSMKSSFSKMCTYGNHPGMVNL
jgi:hypothetical protein